ncbi:MAG TPA: type II CAAX endopeptidase family protein [Anaerolineales bacterium]
MNKILHFPLVRILIAVLFVGVGIAVGQTILNLLRAAFSITNTGLANLFAFVLVTPATYFAYWMYVHSIEKRDLTELGPSNAFQEIGLGSLIGFGLFSFIIAILSLLGFYHVNGINFVLLALIGALVGAFVSAFAQELLFRAVIYRITEEWLGTWWALVISAMLFGLIHLSSAGATIFSALSVALQAGVLLAAAYALTHRLWMALGLHMAWDFANDGIFGVGIAGQSGQSLHGLFQANLNGPKLLTGGVLGIEASTITLVVTLIAGIIMLWIAYQKGYFVSHKNKSQREPAHSAAGKISL